MLSWTGDTDVVLEAENSVGTGLRTRKLICPKSVNDIQTWKING